MSVEQNLSYIDKIMKLCKKNNVIEFKQDGFAITMQPEAPEFEYEPTEPSSEVDDSTEYEIDRDYLLKNPPIAPL